ncbi:MAG: chemotaxis protein CheB [Bacteroidota bacterium]|nr:chemotaxis protein CheB [Bacteroidota bacterium]
MAEVALTNARLIIIGGSSGSLEALLQMLPLLKTSFPLPVVLVLHRGTLADNSLTELLASRTTLQVKEADDKDLLEPGCIYIAPPDYHVLLEQDGSLSLDVSEKINFSRPSIDVSFISAAEVYGDGLIAVLLSGANADGALGMLMVAQKGGFVLVQDPATAAVAYMPEKAIQQSPVDRVLEPIAIAALLNKVRKRNR